MDYLQFRDAYNRPCSLIPSEDPGRLWFGVDANRACLSREHVRALMPILERFIHSTPIAITEVDSPLE